MKKPLQILLFIPMFSLVLLLLFFFSLNKGGRDFKDLLGPHKPILAANANDTVTFYYPLVYASGLLPDIELTDAWTNNGAGQPQDFFYLWDSLQYVTSGVNRRDEDVSVDLTWRLESVWGDTEIYNATTTLSPGNWQHIHPDITPEYDGSYTATVEVDYLGSTSTLTTTYPVYLQQAFDRCWLPTVNQMGAWWDSSPYTVWNIYLGGIHYYCPSGDLTPAWVQTVAQQGWKFILTWVGPQAPCSDFIHRFSNNPTTAYGQGITEAAAALDAAEALGLNYETIYYDLEAFYGADSACRLAARKFIEGWTDWLQLQGVKAGVYGSPCNSYMIDWTLNEPPPDDVWIAHWLLPAQYRQNASTWNTACLSNSYWANHQRIRQYAGDHVENWGGVALTIDSNVVDSDLVMITGTLTADPLPFGTHASSRFIPGTPQIRDMDLISPQAGWILLANSLLLTVDGGTSWEDITPRIGDAMILDILFSDTKTGWLATVTGDSNDPGGLAIYHTTDGGLNWDVRSLPVSVTEIADVELEFIDEQTGWALVKVKTSSSFSVGRLYATRDGGNSWVERTAPMGEPVIFVDPDRGWMVGGPAGNQIYTTQDGGLTWYPQRLPNLPDGQVYFGQPVFKTTQNGVLPVTFLSTPNSALLIYATMDSGKTWHRMQKIDLPQGFEPGTELPFNFFDDTWWAATPKSKGLLTSTSLTVEPEITIATGLPHGVVKLDFVTKSVGWALVQDNQCYGDKTPGSTLIPSPFYCQLSTRLYETSDGGDQWMEIQP